MIQLPKTIKWVITDFDGIVTDNCAYIDTNGNTSRRVNFKDVMGFSILKKNGFNIAIISGEANSAIDWVSKKFNLTEVHQGIRIKIDIIKTIIKKYNLTKEEFVYIGDDINDIEALNFAKYRITVPCAMQKVLNLENIQVTEAKSGEGAFREIADCLVD
jgi:YrbI family 3-deoxy-D-manno-octulosonate 8-phosphate phosphatase